jgi:RNA polymerase primary sigma factor
LSDNLQRFFKAVGETNLLSREEEVELSKKIELGDQRARDRMIRANIRLAISIAKKYSKKGVDLEDLIQESSLGLIKAVDRFDWRKGFKFSTYACWWIKQAVRQHVAAQAGAIKLPSYARGTLYKMKEVTLEYRKEFGVDPSQKELADLLGTSPDTLQSLIKSAATPVAFDAAAYNSDDSSRTMHEILIDRSGEKLDDVLDGQKLSKAIKEALGNLTPREETVLRMRFGITEDIEQEKGGA